MVNYTQIEILLNGSNKNWEEKDYIIDRVVFIENNWNEFTELEYYSIIKELKNNQLDKIAFGLNYQANHITKHLKQLE